MMTSRGAMWCRMLVLSLGLAPVSVLRAQHDVAQRAPDTRYAMDAREAIRALE